MQRLLVAHLPDQAERIHLLPRPIRPGLASLSPPAQSGERLHENAERPDAPVTRIAFAGRITAEKGLDTVLEALASIGTELHLELCIAGPIESADYWDRCVELAQAAANGSDRLTVRFLGHLDTDGVDELGVTRRRARHLPPAPGDRAARRARRSDCVGGGAHLVGERPKWAIALARNGAAAVADLTAHTHLRALDQVLHPYV